MTKLQRFQAAIAGEPVDYIPASVWLHFASEHHRGDEAARLHAAFYNEYDFDYIKVMNDYRYPLPGIESVETAEDLQRFVPLTMEDPVFAEQLLNLRTLRAAVGPDVPLIETVFSPSQVLLRGAGNSAWQAVTAYPQAAHHMLRTITATLILYVHAIKPLVNGVFFSVNGANNAPAQGSLPADQFEEFVAPYDKQVLKSAAGLIRIGHIHGYNLDFARVQDYPLEALNWSHHHSQPSLAEARRLTDKALIGGINEVAVFTQTPGEVAADIRRAVAEVGREKFLIGPGCTVLPDTARRTLHAIVETARAL